ncbi:MAG TPA: Gfo/Idh/MocA family oxidoreductase [Bryobacteraceae bacterium]
MDRREFMKASLATSGLGMLPRVASAAEPLRTGMIGTGNRGSYVLGIILQQPDVKVTALCDIKPDRLDKAASAAARDNPATFRDYHELLARKDVDVVFIDSPCDLHVEMAIAALQAGKHVYCEKPAGITAESIARLIKVVRASNRVFCIGQQMRSYEVLKAVTARLRDGIAGDIIMVKAQRHAPTDLAHDGLSADWFFDAKRSGDVINEMVVHNLDVCNWLIGSHPETAAGFGGTLLWKDDPPGRTNMDGYSLTYDYPKGVKLSFTQVFFHPQGLPGGGQYYYVYGSKGAVDVLSGKFYPRENGAPPEVIFQPARERDDPHVAAFFEAVRTGKKPPADIEIGATAALTAILGREAIYRKTVTRWSDFKIDI